MPLAVPGEGEGLAEQSELLLGEAELRDGMPGRPFIASGSEQGAAKVRTVNASMPQMTSRCTDDTWNDK